MYRFKALWTPLPTNALLFLRAKLFEGRVTGVGCVTAQVR